jgi:hypothetical protein
MAVRFILYMGDHHSFHLIRRCSNLFCNVQQTNIWILILHSVLYWQFTIIFIYKQIENVIWILLFTLRFLINVYISVTSWLFALLVEDTGVPPSVWKTLAHNVVFSTPRLSGIWTHNTSGNRHWLHRVVNSTTIRSRPRQP